MPKDMKGGRKTVFTGSRVEKVFKKPEKSLKKQRPLYTLSQLCNGQGVLR
jgi:hypothetical protein